MTLCLLLCLRFDSFEVCLRVLFLMIFIYRACLFFFNYIFTLHTSRSSRNRRAVGPSITRLDRKQKGLCPFVYLT